LKFIVKDLLNANQMGVYNVVKNYRCYVLCACHCRMAVSL